MSTTIFPSPPSDGKEMFKVGNLAWEMSSGEPCYRISEQGRLEFSFDARTPDLEK
jgi:hypothetical protein